ncbi:MAG: nitronate monooxygenase [Pyramidobacter sp.]|jgi:enoyl-[acyl-carrier protein] reductase II|nr:nitronate monooxygenase [Pyramidobacter sp.]MBQ4491202.1 nitronate monooxygenase [Pyramidobacter sp.]MBQ8090606.1 nitronate monooxygenase [Pyramidobacter sp.]
MLGKELTDLLGIKYPVIQGAMAWIANAELAAAVSNAGGLGIIAAGNTPPELLEKELIKIRELTDKPYGMNIMLMSPTAPAAVELAAKYRVKVLTTGAGSPGKVIERLKPLGTIIMPVVASTAVAIRAVRQGAQAIVAEGMEAGGHIGELTTMVLTPLVAQAVDVPVVCAGGIVDGRGLAAAFAMGAAGVQVGTRFVCSTECTVHPNYKNALVKAKERCTAVTGAPTGHPVRCIENKLTKEFLKLEYDHAPNEQIEKLGTGRLRAAVVDGDVEMGSVMSGQSAALVNDVRPCADIITGMVSEAEEILRKLGAKAQ